MKRVLAFWVFAVMLFATGSAMGLNDIANHWAAEDISALVEKGVIKGISETEYAPNLNMTRAQFVAIMNRAFPDATRASGTLFDDVSESDWFYNDVMKGLVNGMGDGIFGPDLPINRQDACVLVARYMGSETTSTAANISDYDTVSDYAKEAVSTMIAFGTVGGYPDGTFKPFGNITRAEVASIVNRALGEPEVIEPEKPAEPWVELLEFKPSEGEVTYEFTGKEFCERVDGAPVLQRMMNIMQYEIGSYYSHEAKHSSTSTAMQQLISGKKDIIVVPYPSEADFAKAEAAGVQLEGIPIAKDALVFYPDKFQSINYLTADQLKDIFSEEIKTWSECVNSTILVGEIKVHYDDDTRFGLLEFLGDVPLKKGSSAPFEHGAYSSIITCSYYYASSSNTNRSSNYIDIGDTKLTKNTIRSGEYPTAVNFYAIIRSDSPEGSFERELIKYMLSIKGQRVIEDAGYMGY